MPTAYCSAEDVKSGIDFPDTGAPITDAIINEMIIESQEEIFTPAVCIAEIKRKYLKESKEFKTRIDFIIKRSKVIKIDLDISLNAASLCEEKELYMVDAIVYASALQNNSELLTGDLHLKGFEKVRFLD